ncbi:16093_t:CDS:1, partial [Racocetra persica]
LSQVQARHPVKHAAQFKLSRVITTDEPLSLQSVNETLTARPPPEIPITETEIKLLA